MTIPSNQIPNPGKVFFDHVSKTSVKCIFCYPRTEKGVVNGCVAQCPGRIRFVGFVDDPESPVHKLVKVFKVALPLHAEYGTEPNVYYIPPLSPPKIGTNGEVLNEPRIPISYLIGLFGPRVPEVLDILQIEMGKTRNGESSELLSLLNSNKRWKL